MPTMVLLMPFIIFLRTLFKKTCWENCPLLHKEKHVLLFSQRPVLTSWTLTCDADHVPLRAQGQPVTSVHPSHRKPFSTRFFGFTPGSMIVFSLPLFSPYSNIPTIPPFYIFELVNVVPWAEGIWVQGTTLPAHRWREASAPHWVGQECHPFRSGRESEPLFSWRSTVRGTTTASQTTSSRGGERLGTSLWSITNTTQFFHTVIK